MLICAMQYIAKEKTFTLLKYCNIGAFIDCSGSTSTRHRNKNYLEIQKDIIQTLTKENIIYWDDQIHDYCKEPRGGTKPQQILVDKKSLALFEKSDVIILSTDGEISKNDVKDFAKRLELRNNKALFICIIISKSRPDLSNTNISVIYPLLVANNMLCIYYDAENDKSYVIASKGQIANIYPNPTSYDINLLQQINIQDLSNINISLQKLPPNSIILSETETQYKIITKESLPFGTNIEENEWPILIQYCVVNSCTDMLSKLILKNRNKELEECEKVFENPFTRQKEELIERMAKACLDSNTEEQLYLKRELDKIKDQALQEEIAYKAYISTVLTPIRRKYNMISSLLSDMEKQSDNYNLSSYSSNRAKRAAIIDDEEDTVTHEGVPTFTCAVCLDDRAPATLWLNKGQIEDTMSDFHIDFPLTSYPKLKNTIVANPVCGNCAPIYFNKIKKSVYNEPIIGYIPLNLNNKANKSFAIKTLCRAYADNKNLTHVTKLLLSVIDDSDFEWLAPIKDYIINNLLNNIITTVTLTDEGAKDTLMNALLFLIKDQESIFRQPFSSAIRILKFAKLFHNINNENLLTMFVRRFAFAIIERYSIITKDDCAKTNEKLSQIIFEHKCGIPQKLQNCDLTSLQSFFGPSYNDIIYNIQLFAKTINIKESNIITSNLLHNILWHLMSIAHHNRPLNIYKQFENDKYFREISYTDVKELTDMKDIIQKDKFDKYKETSLNNIPEYAAYNGEFSCPSKLWFYDVPLFLDLEDKTYNIRELSEILKQRLARYLENNFGSYYPNDTSGHVMLHRTIAFILETKYKGCEYTDQMVYDCMKTLKNTNGNYGNIYKDFMVRQVIATVQNFCDLRKRSEFNDGSPRFEHKLRLECEKYGMETTSTTINFVKSKIFPRANIDYSTPEIYEIEKRIIKI